MMYIDHHVPPEDAPVVTNNTARKDLRECFIGCGRVQKDRAWISDSRVLNRLSVGVIKEQKVNSPCKSQKND
eukprot:3623438-Ditylum_brightwellii.AAC.1